MAKTREALPKCHVALRRFPRPAATVCHIAVKGGCHGPHFPPFHVRRPNGRMTLKEMTMKTFIASMTVTAALTTAAMAGGPTEPIPEPIPAPVPVAAPVDTGGEWGGAYVGAGLGYGDIGSSTGTLDGTGALGGLQAGYRYDFGKAVIGGEIEYDIANIDLGTTDGDQLDSVARLKAMAGADLGRTLVYGTAGYAYAQATVGGASLDDNGWFAGIGADYAISDRWSVGGEVLTHQFDNFANSGADLDATTAKARVNFSF
jgi:outer membrane immunogenic protein